MTTILSLHHPKITLVQRLCSVVHMSGAHTFNSLIFFFYAFNECFVLSAVMTNFCFVFFLDLFVHYWIRIK